MSPPDAVDFAVKSIAALWRGFVPEKDELDAIAGAFDRLDPLNWPDLLEAAVQSAPDHCPPAAKGIALAAERAGPPLPPVPELDMPSGYADVTRLRVIGRASSCHQMPIVYDRLHGTVMCTECD